MNIERTGLARRAERHAALADPARLRIVDRVTLGDVSPSDLQAELGISSALLAHHLRQLERAGLIERLRSDGDRRRSYVHLLPDGFDGLTPAPRIAARRIVFVCTANSARSQLAAALWRRSSDVPVASAGTRPADAIEPGAVAAARRHGLALLAARPRALAEVLDAGDWLITVCDTAYEELRGRDAAHWSVTDPVRIGTEAAFDTAFEDLARRIDGLAPRITAA